MKLKQYLTLGIGMVAGFGLSLAGLSHASKNESNHSNLITSDKAKTIMTNKVPGATILEFSYDGDDRIPKYDGTLIKDNYEYEIDVNAKTGEVIKFEKEKVFTPNNNNINTNNLITSEKAKSIMMGKVPGATIIEFSYDGDDRIPKYDGTLKKDNYKYEIDVNAKTGEVIKFEKEKIFIPNNTSNSNVSASSSINNQQSTTKPSYTQNNINNNVNTNTPNKNNTSTNTQSNSYIGEAKAKSIMLSKVPGATIRGFHLDYDRTPEYEAELIKGDFEYEISVDARTGAIREFSKERIEKYDDDMYDDDMYDDDYYDYDDDRYDDDRYDD